MVNDMEKILQPGEFMANQVCGCSPPTDTLCSEQPQHSCTEAERNLEVRQVADVLRNADIQFDEHARVQTLKISGRDIVMLGSNPSCTDINCNKKPPVDNWNCHAVLKNMHNDMINGTCPDSTNDKCGNDSCTGTNTSCG
jgi:hypothetical protein